MSCCKAFDGFTVAGRPDWNRRRDSGKREESLNEIQNFRRIHPATHSAKNLSPVVRKNKIRCYAASFARPYS